MTNLLRIALAAGRRTVAAPRLLLLLWIANALFAAPLALAVGQAIRDDLGPSRMHVGLRDGFSTAWQAEYEHRTTGVGALFSPLRTGRGLVLENLDAWFSGHLFAGSPVLLATAIVYGTWWIFAQGAILTVAGGDPGRSFAALAAAGGRSFARLAPLAGIAWLGYSALYRIGAWSFGRLDEAFRDRGSESALLVRVLVLGTVFVAALHALRLVLDYAKVAAVADDVGFVSALWRGLRFVVARPWRTAGLYLLMGTATLLLLAAWVRWAPGPGQATVWAVVAAFVAGQLFVAARITVRATGLAAQRALYEGCGGL